MPYRDIRRIAAETSSKPYKVLAPFVVVTLCFCAICAHILIEARHAALERAGDTAASLAAAIESDLVRNIETLDLSLRAVIDNLKHPEINSISPGLRQLVLFDRAATARHLGAILVLDEHGALRYDSRAVQPKPADLSDRDYFLAHKNGQSSVLYIGRPQVSKTPEQHFLGISRRLTHSDGSFAGVVAGSLRLSYFKQLFQDIALGPNGNITLSHTNGTVLMRWPYEASYIGRDLSQGELYKRLAKANQGRFETNSITDGVHRLVVYRQIGDLPIVVGVGQATEDVYAQWRRYAWTIGLLVAVLCVLAGMLGALLLREFRQRDLAEKKLAALATMDGLTGLSNRWHFDETIHRAWHRAQRERAPLSLLMIDTDLFKAYNDSHGHQAGDQLLKAIGAAISACIRRGIDLGARYGGDEFAVLLPGTSLAAAIRVAERIRAELGCHGPEQDAGEAAITISIGAACLVAEPSRGHTELLAAADAALYRAKHDGRNRIGLAETASIRTEPEAAAAMPQAA